METEKVPGVAEEFEEPKESLSTPDESVDMTKPEERKPEPKKKIVKKVRKVSKTPKVFVILHGIATEYLKI